MLFIIALQFQGRIHQIEYAMEAVKQGSATVGLKSKTHAVLVALKVSKLFGKSFELLVSLAEILNEVFTWICVLCLSYKHT